MYTSGWPKIQNRCCHSSELPPNSGFEELHVVAAAHLEQEADPTTSVVKAKTIMNAVTSIAQANSGMRAKVMPGARNLRMLMMISMPAAMAATSATLRPRTQKSSGRSGEILGQAERRVGEPAGVGHQLEQRAAVVEEPAHQVGEEAVGAEARERHLPGAEQERQQQDGEALGDRQDDEEHRHRAVVGEQLVVQLGADEVVLRERPAAGASRASRRCRRGAGRRSR